MQLTERDRRLLEEIAALDRFYSDDELDALEESDPERAYELDRAQTLARRHGLQPGQGPEAIGGTVDPHKVQAALEEAAEHLRGDGGGVELVEIRDTTVRVRMVGACSGCPSSTMDLKTIVEQRVKNRVPAVTEVVNTI